MMMVLCFCVFDASAARKVLVVLSSDSKQYQISASRAGALIDQGSESEVVLKLLSQLKKSDYDMLSKDDICLAVGAKAALSAARNLDQSVPLVYSMVPNPGMLGLDTRPRTTGISADVPPLVQFELMRRAQGTTRTVGVLYRSSSQRSMDLLGLARDQLPAGWELKGVDLDEHGSDAKGVRALIDLRVDFAWMISDPKVYSAATVKALLIASIRNKMRVFAFSPQVVKAGALIGIGVDPGAQGDQAGKLVLRVQRLGIDVVGAQPISAPDPDIAINQMVAKRIGAVISKILLNEADFLYE